MNLGELRTMVRGYLNEPFAAFWTDAELNGHINTGCKKVHNRIKTVSRYHFTTRATFPTTVDAGYYQLPADCKDVKLITRIDLTDTEIPLTQATWPDPTAFTPGLLMDPEAGADLDGPSFYWVVGNSLRLLPIPKSVLTIRLYYEARIVNLVANLDIPSFDGDYHDVAAKWAALEAGVKDNKSQKNLGDLLTARDTEMIADVLHRVPVNAQMTESYLGD